jgi:two-component system, chemotaxis family, chemotaxis protein CheY
MSNGPIHIPATVIGEPIFVEADRPLYEIVPSVLVVDDSQAARGVVRRLLHELGIGRVSEAADAAAALREAHAQSFAAILADVEMTPHNGFSLLKALRDHPRTAGLPVLLMTATGKSSHAQRARAADADAYLLKPFTATVLRETLREAVLARQAGRRAGP